MSDRTNSSARRDAALRERLGNRFFAVSVAAAELAENTVRASSVIENLNSRLRNYFSLRRQSVTTGRAGGMRKAPKRGRMG